MGFKNPSFGNHRRGIGCSGAQSGYSDLSDPDERVARLLAMPLPAHDRLVLVGSSMGGYVSTVASQTLKPSALFLMAPAFYMPGYAIQTPTPGTARVSVAFGCHDEVIPVEHGIRFAQEHQAELHVLNSDHRLNSVLPELGILFENFLKDI